MKIIEEKKCRDCKKMFGLDDFYSYIFKRRLYLKSYCKKCDMKRHILWAKKNIERKREIDRNCFRKKYGVPEILWKMN